MKDYTTSVTAQNAAIGCEPGYELKVVDGKDAVNVRTKCCMYYFLLCWKTCHKEIPQFITWYPHWSLFYEDTDNLIEYGLDYRLYVKVLHNRGIVRVSPTTLMKC